MTRRYTAVAVVAVAVVVGCQGGAPTVFGYKLGADALYDTNICTVYVPTFTNRAFQTTPFRGIEVDLQRAVVREIGKRTRFKVVSDPERADTELQANVVGIDKTILNRNLQNLIREADVVLSVDVLWRDLRSGEVLSAPKRGRQPGRTGVPELPGDPVPLFDPTDPAPPPPAVVQAAPPTRLVATG
ncbi:MAG TPA: LPS assembly lipoprotein LptE, partial [Urbifossiella sp.]|nr:LPS assembly lipoprotein LptE [Urbifossiella sp.]